MVHRRAGSSGMHAEPPCLSLTEEEDTHEATPPNDTDLHTPQHGMRKCNAQKRRQRTNNDADATTSEQTRRNLSRRT